MEIGFESGDIVLGNAITISRNTTIEELQNRILLKEYNLSAIPYVWYSASVQDDKGKKVFLEICSLRGSIKRIYIHSGEVRVDLAEKEKVRSKAAYKEDAYRFDWGIVREKSWNQDSIQIEYFLEDYSFGERFVKGVDFREKILKRSNE